MTPEERALFVETITDVVRNIMAPSLVDEMRREVENRVYEAVMPWILERAKNDVAAAMREVRWARTDHDLDYDFLVDKGSRMFVRVDHAR